jgi:hypothetical protein
MTYGEMVMKSKVLIILAIMAVACWVSAASATCYDLTSGQSTGTINLPGIASGGFAGTATAVFTFTGGDLDIVFTNTDSAVTNSGTVLAALFWSSGQTTSGTGTATANVLVHSGSNNVTSFWGYGPGNAYFNGTFAGNQGVSAVGLGYGFVPLDGSKSNNIAGLAYSLITTATGTPSGNLANHAPYCENQVHIVLDLPVGTTHYALCDPTAWWGTEHTQVPIPPSVLLMGSGLLGLGLVGWRRQKKA